MSEYDVDVVIAVHSAERPVDRAARSVLLGTRSRARVSVIAHNIDPEIIRTKLGPLAEHPDVRLLELRDGIQSPAGPMNLGFDEADAPFVALLGSDDELANGAIDSWLQLQRETGAEAVLARIQLATGGFDPYPPVRGGRRTRELDGERDRLAYRSAPLGMVSRERFADLRLTTGVGSGEDLVYSLTVWFTGARLAYALRCPPYIVNGDADDRVTSSARSLVDDFAFLDHLESRPWFAGAAPGKRRAIVVKLFRMQVFDALHLRTQSDEQFEAERAGFSALVSRLEGLEPGSLALLSRADRRALDAISTASAADIRALVAARGNYRSPAAIMPRNFLKTFHRQAPFRTLLAGLLTTRGV